ncbi:15213_t:CDS:2, partial [Dentiscutata erythropus]
DNYNENNNSDDDNDIHRFYNGSWIGDLYDLSKLEKKEKELQKTISFDTLLETYSKGKLGLTQIFEDATIEFLASFMSISETSKTSNKEFKRKKLH